MKPAHRWLAVALLMAALIAVSVQYWRASTPAVVPVTPAAAPPVAGTAAASFVPPAPLLRLQLAAGLGEPLPAIDDSDAVLGSQLAGLFGREAWLALFRPEMLVRRIVATIDNLPRRDAPVGMWPLKPVGSWLATQVQDGRVFVAPENARRYAAYVAWIERTDADRAVAFYLHFYPLFQEAYEALGFPGAYFNDRLKTAIDDLLATPELAAPPALVPDNVRYRFADPALDRCSAGQKILLRMGRDNTRIVKAKLRELRAALARHERPEGVSDRRMP